MAIRLYKKYVFKWGQYRGIRDVRYNLLFGKSSFLDLNYLLLWGKNKNTDNLIIIKWGKLKIIDNMLSILWGKAKQEDQKIVILWRKTKENDACLIIKWKQTKRPDPDFYILWKKTRQNDQFTQIKWAINKKQDKQTTILWGLNAKRDSKLFLLWQKTKALDTSVFSTHTFGVDNIPQQRLKEACLIRWALAQGVIILKHDITLTRVSDSKNIPIMSGSVSIDVDSWLWEFRGELPDRSSALLVDPKTQGGPVEVLLTIDGWQWRLMIRKMSDNYQYGQGSYSIYGTSLSAELAAPFTPKITKTWDSLTSAQAIITEELTNKGWGANYNILDWNIDGGIFSVENATPAEIVSTVVKTAGAIMQTHRHEKNIEIMYKLPISPKDFDNTEVKELIQSEVILGQSSEVLTQPKYNYVIVSGKDAGVLLHVKRTGTPADIPAPPVIEPLLTTLQVNLKRGTYILDEEGYDKIKVTLNLPLMPYGSAKRPTLLLPTDLIQVDDLFESWKGTVYSTSISFNGATITMNLEVMRFLI